MVFCRHLQQLFSACRPLVHFFAQFSKFVGIFKINPNMLNFRQQITTQRIIVVCDGVLILVAAGFIRFKHSLHPLLQV